MKPPTRDEINELWNAGGMSLDDITQTAEALAVTPFISGIMNTSGNVLTAAMLVLMGILIAEKRAAQKETV